MLCLDRELENLGICLVSVCDKCYCWPEESFLRVRNILE